MLDPNRPLLARSEFDEILLEHADLIRLNNELELCLYEMGDRDPPDHDAVTNCRQIAGELISRLRTTLFRLDQQVYPLIDPNIPSDEAKPL